MWTLLALADFFQCCLAVPVLPDCQDWHFVRLCRGCVGGTLPGLRTKKELLQILHYSCLFYQINWNLSIQIYILNIF